MAGWKFTIKKDRLAERCEICHKSDLFHPGTGICERCQPLPLEQLTEQSYLLIRAIPPSRAASLIALLISSYCFITGFISMHAFFQPYNIIFSYSHTFLIGLLMVNLFSAIFSLALRHWCSERYNERLQYRIVILGRICAVVGLSGSAFGFYLALPSLLSLFALKH